MIKENAKNLSYMAILADPVHYIHWQRKQLDLQIFIGRGHLQFALNNFVIAAGFIISLYNINEIFYEWPYERPRKKY